MKFDYSFFLDEVRDDFYISGLMKRLWAAQLTVIEDVANLCKKHNIKWFIEFGSLLGAVRHNGYVPWDDDFDICMLRDDYDKFNELSRKELPKNYTVMDFHSHDYWDQVLRITNATDVLLNDEHMTKYHNFPYPAGIDVFCLDYISPDDKKEEERCHIASIIMSLAVSSELVKPYSKDILDALHSVEKLCNVTFDLNGNLKRQLYLLGEKYYKMFPKEGATKVALMRYWLDYKDHCYPITLFDGNMLLPFENTMLPAPIGYYDKLLSDYGQFWTINRNGGLHNYPIYDSNEKLFIDYLKGQYPFFYHFNENDLSNTGRISWNQFKQKAIEMYNLLTNICSKITLLYSDNNISTLLSILESCQNVAIQTGTLLENELGEGLEEVSCLENFCENVFALYELLADTTNPENVDKHSDKVDEIKEAVNKSFSLFSSRVNNNRVAIITSRSAHFKEIEPIYNFLINSSYSVDVIYAPYYERNVLGSACKKIDESDSYPTNVHLIQADTYDFKKIHPSIIISQLGFDHCNYTFTQDIAYYVSTLKKYTDCFIYASPYSFKSISPNDAKAIKSLEHLAIIPGVLQSDYVVVNNNNVKEIYINYILENANDSLNLDKGYWNKKILDTNSFFDCVLKNTRNSDSSKLVETSHNDRKKKILIYFSSATLCLCDNVENVINNVITLLINHIDSLDIMWFFSDFDLRYIKENASELYKYIEENILANNKIQVTSNIENGSLCDAYYGDVSHFIRIFSSQNKPVMIQNVTHKKP